MINEQGWFDLLDETIKEIWPEFFNCLERKEPFSVKQISLMTRDAVLPGQGGECIGLGQTVGQCGRSKPSAESPVKGLYYVGTDAGGYGCGTHQAIDSAFNVSDQALRYHKNH